jgi:hypothetical protein
MEIIGKRIGAIVWTAQFIHEMQRNNKDVTKKILRCPLNVWRSTYKLKDPISQEVNRQNCLLIWYCKKVYFAAWL